ncbi:c-type cytochrome [Methylacidiphilum kamchatkense]|nr:cytochrome c [Methylacidiphilum kamchatkense]
MARSLLPIVFFSALAFFSISSQMLLAIPREQALYFLHCAGCHGLKGEGIAGVSPQIAQTIDFFLLSPEGRKYVIQVPGVAFSSIPDDALAELLNWLILNFGQTKRKFQKYTTQEVAVARKEPLLDVDETRKRILQTLPDKITLIKSWQRYATFNTKSTK